MQTSARSLRTGPDLPVIGGPTTHLHWRLPCSISPVHLRTNRAERDCPMPRTLWNPPSRRRAAAPAGADRSPPRLLPDGSSGRTGRPRETPPVHTGKPVDPPGSAATCTLNLEPPGSPAAAWRVEV